MDENLLAIKTATIAAIRAQRSSLDAFGPEDIDARAAYRPFLARAARAADLAEVADVIDGVTAFTGRYFLRPDETPTLAL